MLVLFKQRTLDTDNLSYLIIYEVSTIQLIQTLLLSCTNRQSKTTTPFGASGVPFIIPGNFNQLGPVLKTLSQKME